MFVGEYDRSVDGNGRVALPSAFRDELGERCYVSRAPNGCLTVTSVDEFRSGAQRVLDPLDEVGAGEPPAEAVDLQVVARSQFGQPGQAAGRGDELVRPFPQQADRQFPGAGQENEKAAKRDSLRGRFRAGSR